MAALSYQRTRLVRAWTHLERQRGGLGFVGGPGETQIEADRRAIDEQLVRLKKPAGKGREDPRMHRAARAKVPYPVVALVGYTNAGKSTLFNRLTGAEVLAKDMLFATLDPTMRAVRLPRAVTSSCRTRWASSRICRPSWSPPSAPRWKRCWPPISSSMSATSRIEAVTEALDEARVTETLSVPFAEGRRRAWLFEQGVVVDELQTEMGHDLKVHWTPRQRAAFHKI
jgi:hypothetical protein